MLLEAVGSTSGSGAATTLSCSYTGNRRSTYGYDINGNVTNDATNSLQTSYNLLNLPVQTKSGSTVKANYSYLSDGTKASVLNASGAGYDYNGTFTYSHASGGTRTLESIAFGGGRIRKNGSSYAVDYYVTDHLGSVRAIVNASGAIVEQNDFYPFGTRQQNGLTTLSANRWRFSGKEGYDGAFGIALDDFGARLFDRSSWTSIDPLAEKYYSISPYAYCAGNPVRFVDLEGEKIIIGSSLGQFFAKFGINNFENKVNADIENLKQIGKGNELGEIISRIEDSEQFTIAIKHARHNPRKNGNAYFMKYNTFISVRRKNLQDGFIS